MVFRTTPVTLLIGTLLLVAVLFGSYVILTVPADFPVGKTFIVEEGESLRSISNRLYAEHYITSALWFRAWISILGRDRHVQLGGYVFDSPLPLSLIVGRLVFGKPDVPLISVTIPEGSTTKEIAQILSKALPHFSADVFDQKVSVANASGKLFPSTYFLLPSTTEEAAIALMVATFERKYAATFGDANATPLDRNQVISLAAIIEGEAKSKEDMKLVAGILLKRFTLKMPLQVDVAPETYTKRGFPQIPINNPGLVALDAALYPTAAPYLYYLTGKDGTMHYAKTFAEHTANIRKYLR